MQQRVLALRAPLAAIALVALVGTACTGADNPPSTTPTQQPGVSSPTPMTSDAGSTAPGSSVPPASAGATPGAPLSSDPLHAIVLTDVRSGEQISIGALAASRPLLLETMAIWCTNCRQQQSNVIAAHTEADFHSISLDVDPGETPEALAAYSADRGFDWHFAMADADLLAQLRERFGTAVVVPPGMPKILFRTDGSVEMVGLGELWTAQQIVDAVNG